MSFNCFLIQQTSKKVEHGLNINNCQKDVTETWNNDAYPLNDALVTPYKCDETFGWM